MAEGTSKNLVTQWHKFLKFCQTHGLDAWPTSVHMLCLYAQYLSTHFRSVQSILNYLNGVRLLHLFAGVAPPNFNDFKLKLTLKGIKRTKKHAIKQAEPITPKILLDMRSMMNLSNPLHVVLWALFLVGFYLMLRKSNLVPDSIQTFDPFKQLLRSDLQLNKKAAVFHIKWTKTLQFGQKILSIPVPANRRSKLCPVKLLRRMLRLREGKREDPLFADCRGRPITYSVLLTNLRRFLKQAGYKQQLFSGHSLRRGSAEFAFQSNVPSEHGDWASLAYERYFSYPLKMRALVGASMKARINSLGY